MSSAHPARHHLDSQLPSTSTNTYGHQATFTNPSNTTGGSQAHSPSSSHRGFRHRPDNASASVTSSPAPTLVNNVALAPLGGASSFPSSSVFPNLFTDFGSADRRDTLALPKIGLGDNVSIAASSRSSSPYVSPRLSPKVWQGGMGSMGEITLPPLSSAVPMRRGAVSGASSGPSLPFPPIRLPNSEEEVPSRGPSPTLGKRPSFSLGHSNHVPPGPDAQLPMPALSGPAERRGGVSVPPTQQLSSVAGTGSSYAYQHGGDHANHDYSRTGAIRMSDDGTGYYYASSASNTSAPRSTGPSTWSTYNKAPRGEMTEDGQGGVDSYNYNGASVAGSINRPAQFSDEPYYSHHPHGTSNMDAHSSTHAGRYPGQTYGRYEMDVGPYGMAPRQMSYGLSMSPDDHLMPINGKRPRSAPRVLSSQPRIFACSQCPARFARNHDLKRHQRGHLSVRPYPCTWCGKSFSRKDALKRHVLVKGCGKDKRGGDKDGKGNGSMRKSGSGEDGGTERSRSNATDDRDDDDRQHDDDRSDLDDEEDHLDDSQSSLQHDYTERQQERRYSPYQSAHHQSHPSSDIANPGAGLYRWNKPYTMPSLISPATVSMRAGDFAGMATSLVGFAARRPSASIV